MTTKILIVDDNEQNRYMLQVLLQGNGYEVVTVANGAEALAAARDEPPDLIITDILMPVMDGFSLCRHWKADEQLNDIPFIIYTATYTDSQDEAFALSLGAERFIVKPVEPDDFIRILHEVIAGREAGTLVARHESLPEEPVYYRQYNQALISKLEDKMLELEAANRALAFDIAEREQVEAALRAAEAQYRTLVEQLPAITYIVELGQVNRTVYISPQIEEVLGFSPEAWLADPELWLKQLHPNDRERVVAEMRRVDTTGESLNIEYRSLAKSGQVVWLHNLNQRMLLPDESGRIRHRHGVMFDITGRKQLEEQYQQAQKMEAIGQLTAGIAHDFNNLLTVMNGFAELMKLQLLPDNPLWEMVDKVSLSGERATNLVRQLLMFSRKQIVEPTILDLNLIVSRMEAMLGRVIGEHIRMETHLAPDLWPVKADLTQIEQVIVNLAVNARDAMPQGGRLIIETTNIVLDEDFVAMHLAVQPGEHVLLSVSDTGVGMTQEVKARLFEPFFTTKRQGTGLGLATVYGIVKQSGGHIWVYSEPGQGTTFKIYLPLVKTAAEPGLFRRAHQGAPDAGTETVLLVEDEAMIRDLVKNILQTSGYSVLEAQQGTEAVQIAEQYEPQIHLLLTDVILPGGMSGPGIAQHLSSLYPDMKVLYMSGYATDNAIVQQGDLDSGVTFLQKPFRPIDLLYKVREVLDLI